MTTMITEKPVARHVRWPAERFYWACVNDAGRPVAGELPPGLLAEIEGELPVPLESVHVVCSPAPSAEWPRRVVVCACDVGDIRRLDADVASLGPASIPTEVSVEGSASELNLLVGACTPARTRSRERRRSLLLLSSLVLVTVCVTAGFLLRARAASVRSDQLRVSTAEILRRQTPDGREESLSAKVGQLRELQAAVAKAGAPFDASGALSRVIAGWPLTQGTTVHSINVSREMITVSASFDPSQVDAAGLLSSIAAPEGYEATEPRLANGAGITRLTLVFRAKGGAK
jgi:hypothetical protein